MTPPRSLTLRVCGSSHIRTSTTPCWCSNLSCCSVQRDAYNIPPRLSLSLRKLRRFVRLLTLQQVWKTDKWFMCLSREVKKVDNWGHTETSVSGYARLNLLCISADLDSIVRFEVFTAAPSGMLSRVALVRTDVSASFIRVTRIGELGTTQAVTSNRRTLFLVHRFLSPWWRRR
jgi:hypothetical protein